MAEQSNNEDAVLDPALTEPLIAALDDEDADIRVGALWALLALPHPPAIWLAIGQNVNGTLRDHEGRSIDELRSVVAASPWIPLASTRELVARIAGGELELGEAVVSSAVSALERIANATTGEPTSSRIDSVGFSEYSDGERRQLSHELEGLSIDQLWAELREQSSTTRPPRRAALVVTMLMEKASRAGDVGSGFDVTRWVDEHPTAFMPDLEGLFDELLRLRRQLPRSPELIAARQIAWLVSRGGLIQLLAALQARLKSNDREQRLTAFSLIQYAAALMRERSAPTYWVGAGVELAYQEPAIPPRATLVDDTSGSHQLHVDDDVQFTVYRPSRVTPEDWHRFLAFAHRTAPIALPSGEEMRPVEEVEQRAAQVLAGLPTSYDTVRADSQAGLPRGTDLLFEPWIEIGEFNPATQSLRWEEPIHEVHFRLRVPQSADGSRLSGGMRVFAGAVLIGDLTFRLPVSSEKAAANAPTERDTTRRFRQIFASYSHRDVAVVDAVERYVSVIGDRYLIDARTLRSGEAWNERLCQLIREADVFQLFWSDNAMNSSFVRQEWEYALQLGREGFVRPVYWQDPLPEDPDRNLPPTELRRLHFSKLRVDPVAPSGSRPPASSDGATGAATPHSTRARVVCATCGFLNEANEAFCGSCGSYLQWESQRVEPESPAAGTPTPAPTPSPVVPAAAPSAAHMNPERDAAMSEQTQPRHMARRRRVPSFSLIVALAIAIAIVAMLVLT
jgi:TIR domain